MRCCGSVRVLYAIIGFLASGRALGNRQDANGIIPRGSYLMFLCQSAGNDPVQESRDMIAGVMDKFMNEHQI